VYIFYIQTDDFDERFAEQIFGEMRSRNGSRDVVVEVSKMVRRVVIYPLQTVIFDTSE
jgi:hypothetical protein